MNVLSFYRYLGGVSLDGFGPVVTGSCIFDISWVLGVGEVGLMKWGGAFLGPTVFIARTVLVGIHRISPFIFKSF